MTGRSQTLSWWLEGGGVKTTKCFGPDNTNPSRNWYAHTQTHKEAGKSEKNPWNPTKLNYVVVSRTCWFHDVSSQSTIIPRVPQCLSPCEKWDPLSRKRFPPPEPKGGGGTLVCGWVGGGVPIRTTGEKDARTEYPRALTAWVTKIARVDFSRSLFHFWLLPPLSKRPWITTPFTLLRLIDQHE